MPESLSPKALCIAALAAALCTAAPALAAEAREAAPASPALSVAAVSAAAPALAPAITDAPVVLDSASVADSEAHHFVLAPASTEAGFASFDLLTGEEIELPAPTGALDPLDEMLRFTPSTDPVQGRFTLGGVEFSMAL